MLSTPWQQQQQRAGSIHPPVEGAEQRRRACTGGGGSAAATHRPFEGTVRSFQIVTSATAQLLSNIAIGAPWSCKTGTPGQERMPSGRSSERAGLGFCARAAAAQIARGRRQPGGVRGGGGSHMLYACCSARGAPPRPQFAAGRVQGALACPAAWLTGCQHWVVKARRYRMAGAPSSSSCIGDRSPSCGAKHRGHGQS